ncbi:hypothetical protein BH23GEM8_BH23GEM8_19730 [soil metagenome]
MSSALRKRRLRSTSIASVILLTACGASQEAALKVAGVEFSSEQVRGLTQEELEQLADLASVGRAVADGSVDELVASLDLRAVERSRLQAMPLHLGARRMGLDEQALREAYEQDPEWELEVRHIVRLVPRWAGPAERAEAHEVAEQVASRARAGEDFSALAAQLSEEPGAAERGGLLKPGRRGGWVAPFWDAALGLRAGEVSGVVETEYGYHVLRLDEKRTIAFAQASTLPVLRRLVPQSTAVQAMEEWVATRPPLEVESGALENARQALLHTRFPDDIVIARTADGSSYSGTELGLSWVELPADDRRGLIESQDAFKAWARDDARAAIWAEAAGELGVEEDHSQLEGWPPRLRRAAAAFGFGPGLSDSQIAEAALAAISARGQEAMIARSETAGLRMLLRRAYPAVRFPSDSPPAD